MRGGAGMTAVPDMLHDTWQEQLSWQGWPYRLLRLEWQLDHAAVAWQPFTCLHAHLPTCQHAHLLASPPVCMHTCQPACMPTCLHAHLTAYPPACMPTFMQAHLPACPPDCMPTWLFRLSVCLPPFLCRDFCPLSFSLLLPATQFTPLALQRGIARF